MTNSQRAAQFWAVLVLAAHNRQTLTYEMVEKITGIPKYAQTSILGIIVAYCDSRSLPKLTTIVVRELDGLPADGVDDASTVCVKHAKVFAFNWLEQKAPNPKDFEALSMPKE
jgi:hypothetical protein